MSCQLFPLIGYPLLCFILGASLAAWWWPLLASSAFLLASSRPLESLIPAVIVVTPGLKAFPSCLIDNTALARPFLAGLSRLGGSPKPATLAPPLSKFRHYPCFGVHRAVWETRWRRFLGPSAPVRKTTREVSWPMAWRLWQTVFAQCQFLTILCDSRRALSILFPIELLVSGGVLRGRCRSSSLQNLFSSSVTTIQCETASISPIMTDSR